MFGRLDIYILHELICIIYIKGYIKELYYILHLEKKPKDLILITEQCLIFCTNPQMVLSMFYVVNNWFRSKKSSGDIFRYKIIQNPRQTERE